MRILRGLMLPATGNQSISVRVRSTMQLTEVVREPHCIHEPGQTDEISHCVAIA